MSPALGEPDIAVTRRQGLVLNEQMMKHELVWCRSLRYPVFMCDSLQLTHRCCGSRMLLKTEMLVLFSRKRNKNYPIPFTDTRMGLSAWSFYLFTFSLHCHEFTIIFIIIFIYYFNYLLLLSVQKIHDFIHIYFITNAVIMFFSVTFLLSTTARFWTAITVKYVLRLLRHESSRHLFFHLFSTRELKGFSLVSFDTRALFFSPLYLSTKEL